MRLENIAQSIRVPKKTCLVAQTLAHRGLETLELRTSGNADDKGDRGVRPWDSRRGNIHSAFDIGVGLRSCEQKVHLSA